MRSFGKVGFFYCTWRFARYVKILWFVYYSSLLWLLFVKSALSYNRKVYVSITDSVVVRVITFRFFFFSLQYLFENHKTEFFRDLFTIAVKREKVIFLELILEKRTVFLSVRGFKCDRRLHIMCSKYQIL